MMPRKPSAEHPFGTIQRVWNQGYILTKGAEDEASEKSLTILAYTIKRAIKVRGAPRVLETLA